MGHTAGAIAGGDLSHRVESTDPRTEVGRLGIALNAMLDRLEQAFSQREASEDRLRRFLADASHELRTPLASIRGYAELFRMGAAREPEEAARAMRRIEDEAARMGVLVEDLLTLARLDEIAEAPHTEVDLGALAERRGRRTRAATAPDRAITLAAGARSHGARRRAPAAAGARQPAAQRAGAHAGGDRDRGLGGATATAACGWRCATTARACRPDDPDALFERFWRAEGGRERGRAGAGLGLAIVAAIVDAHGGPWALRNAAGRRRGVLGASCLPPEASGRAGELRLGREAARAAAPRERQRASVSG